MSISLDLTKVLAPRYRDRTIDTLIKNLFNRHLTKPDTVPFYGLIGDPVDLQPGEIKISETQLERQLNQLSPLIYYKHATEETLFSWSELVQKLILQGVDHDTIGTWFRSGSYNFVPPINLDMFCNFNEYFWVGGWVDQHKANLSYVDLGIPDYGYVNDAFAAFDPVMQPEYYVIERGDVVAGAPAQIALNFITWSSWSLCNLWVHRDDVITFALNHGLDTGLLVQATRPIIEYDRNVRVNTYLLDGIPDQYGTYNTQRRVSVNQPPLFDLYTRDGSHLGKTSSIFYYSESNDATLDPVLHRRLALDSNGDFLFEHALVEADTNELLFYRNVNTEELRTIWAAGPEVGTNYVKYETQGTLINQDKFNNFVDYFWVGVDKPAAELPAYDSVGLPEYTVIESGGLSDWSTYNFWVHVSLLPKADLHRYVQATRPIIEFNKNLDPELLEAKTEKYQPPRFKKYQFDDVSNTYKRIQYPPLDPLDFTLTDGYLQGKLLSRVVDLPNTIQTALAASPEVLGHCSFEANGELYLQGFYTGEFLLYRDGVALDHIVRQVAYDGIGDGTLNITPRSNAGVGAAEVFTFTYDASLVRFDVQGTHSGSLGSVPIAWERAFTNFRVTPVQGSTQFQTGDVFTVEVKTSTFNTRSSFAKIGDVYRTLPSAAAITSESVFTEIVDATPSDHDGSWEVPPQLWWNPLNETRTTLKQGDLFSHFTTIIAAQPELIGSATGKNNWRTFTHDLGLGGTIKQHDKSTGLLISLLLQEGITISSLLNFARDSYSQLFVEIDEFIENEVPQLLTDRLFEPPVTGDDVDPSLVSAFKDYLARRSLIVSASTNAADDHVSSPFFDSTSSIFNLVATLPYLGLAPKVEPMKATDLELNAPVIVHHDGHRTLVSTTPTTLYKKIVSKKYLRSPGNETSGLITGVTIPERPYKGQFWFKASTDELFFYNVISDTGEMPSDSFNGALSYDRVTNTLYQFVAPVSPGIWIVLGSDAVTLAGPWKRVMLDLISQNLTLALETELYQNCPSFSLPLDVGALEANGAYLPKLQTEFERFASKHGVVDPYSAIYDQADPFTWNYTSSLGDATWQEVYRTVYGTPRPDVQPWISCGYVSESAFLAALIADTLLPPEITAWTPDRWADVLITAWIKNAMTVAGRSTTQLSVDAGGALLPPYSLSGEGYSSVIPTSAASRFDFGDLGPVELLWKKSIDYAYSKQRVYFKLDPLIYVSLTWGTKYQAVDTLPSLIDQGQLNQDIGRREATTDQMLHGDSLVHPRDSTLDVTALSYSTSDLQYTVTCVSRLAGIFKITGSNLTDPQFFTYNWSDSFISLYANHEKHGFVWGDTWIINQNAELAITTVEEARQTFFMSEGFNQLYVQYNRSFGGDLAISKNKSALRGWETKLGYRFGSLINTDQLVIKSSNAELVDDAFKVYIKENKFSGSLWINGLRVQLVQRGSTTRDGNRRVPALGAGETPGEDWIYRVDNFNIKRPEITWKVLDVTGPSTSFVALNGAKTLFNWQRYTTSNSTLRFPAPFLITGIQNLINFILGYADQLHDAGWRFNDADHPIIDPETKRQVDYQLLVEKFIDQQFSSVDAGATFTFNPFSDKVQIYTERGTVSSLIEPIGIEQETVCSVLNEAGRQIDVSKLRVFRQDALTFIVFDEPVFTLHTLVSEYEHVVLFENYSIDALLFDPFLGQQVSSIFISGEKQRVNSGRLDLGGSFLLGHEMKRNVENLVGGILKMYDSSSDDVIPEVKRAKASMGFWPKQYFKDRGTSSNTEFRFWQGLIPNKGTNFSINAFKNSAKFKTASLDEYWAYKLTSYGNSSGISMDEMKVDSEEAYGEKTDYLFVEPDDDFSAYDLGGYDTFEYNGLPFDENGFTTSSIGMLEPFNPVGMVQVTPTDETRWYRLSDLNTTNYFPLTVIAEKIFTLNSSEELLTQIVADWQNYFNVTAGLVGQEDTMGPLSYNAGILTRGVGDLTYWVGPDGDTDTFSRNEIDFVKIASEHPALKTFWKSYYPGFMEWDSLNVTMTHPSGKLVRADCFELIDVEYANLHETGGIYHENGDYVLETDPAEYTQPRFVRLNSYSIRIIDRTLLNRQLKLVAYGPSVLEYSPSQLYNYKQGVLVKDDVIWWDPARGMHSPIAFGNVDYVNEVNPARYNQTLLTANYHEQHESLRPWGEGEVGKVWWDQGDFNWKLYHDSKIYPDLQQRIAMWGAVSDGSRIKVYEWVKSNLSPEEYQTAMNDGSSVVRNFLTRDRTWWQRPVAWRYSVNPEVTPRRFLTYQPHDLSLLLSESLSGSGTAILHEGKFEDLGITKDTKIAGAIYSGFTPKDDAHVDGIFGTAKVTSEKSTINVGSSFSFTGSYFAPSPLFTFSLEIIPEIMEFRSSYLGEYVLGYMHDAVNDRYRLKLTHVSSGINQWIEMGDTPVTAGTQDFYFFDTLGIKIFYTPLFGYADSWTGIGSTTPIVRIEQAAIAIGNELHDIYLRSSVTVSSAIAFTTSESVDEYRVQMLSDFDQWFSDTPVGWTIPMAYGNITHTSENTATWIGRFGDQIIFDRYTTDFVAVAKINSDLRVFWEQHYPGFVQSYIEVQALADWQNWFDINSLGTTTPMASGNITRGVGSSAEWVASDGTRILVDKYIVNFIELTKQHADLKAFFELTYPGFNQGYIQQQITNDWQTYFVLTEDNIGQEDTMGPPEYNAGTITRLVDNMTSWVGPDGDTATFGKYDNDFLTIASEHPVLDVFWKTYYPGFGMGYILNESTEVTRLGWIAWNDPVTNPLDEASPPRNKFEALTGNWSTVGNYLLDQAEDIIARQKDPWNWFDDTSVNPYKSSWTDWVISAPIIKSCIYDIFLFNDNQDDLLFNYFAWPGLTSNELTSRIRVYLNDTAVPYRDARDTDYSDVRIPRQSGVRDAYLEPGTWVPVLRGSTWYVDIRANINEGDQVVVKLLPDERAIDLDFDPAVSDLDPLKLKQHKHDYPCVYRELFGDHDRVSEKIYYFWVENKQSPGASKTMSVKMIATLLGHHDGIYAIPSILKFYNQQDGRPNRHAMLSLNGLSSIVRSKDTYKLRITYDGTIAKNVRAGLEIVPLKKHHEEWITLRKYQSSLIPKVLWDKLVDSLAGENLLGEELPSINYRYYDLRNGTAERYGFNKGQILVDPAVGRATLKYTVLNTQVDKYVNGELIPDYISYPGFDLNQLDSYLSSPAAIRRFMADLWRFAKPKQVNEIFFEILEDVASVNLEMSDFFKTSFVALNDIRTINSETVTYG